MLFGGICATQTHFHRVKLPRVCYAPTALYYIILIYDVLLCTLVLYNIILNTQTHFELGKGEYIIIRTCTEQDIHKTH